MILSKQDIFTGYFFYRIFFTGYQIYLHIYVYIFMWKIVYRKFVRILLEHQVRNWAGLPILLCDKQENEKKDVLFHDQSNGIF